MITYLNLNGEYAANLRHVALSFDQEVKYWGTTRLRPSREWFDISASNLYCAAEHIDNLERAFVIQRESLAALENQKVELKKCLKWAVDILDLYDAEFIKRGADTHEVLSELHVEAKLKCRGLLE